MALKWQSAPEGLTDKQQKSEFLGSEEQQSVDRALKNSMKHALQYMQLCPADISPINTRGKFMLVKIEPVFDIKII